MQYTNRGRANYYDCDVDNHLKVSAAMRYMQQTSSEHLEAIDMSPVELYNEDMVFLLTKMCVKIHRMPNTAEEILIGTAATGTSGPRFAREFVIDAPDGERLVSALSFWILVNPRTRKILRPSGFPYPLPFVKSVMDGEFEDVSFPKAPITGESTDTEVKIRYSQLDTNSHVNNSIYADFVCDALPVDALRRDGLDTLVISFHNEAKYGDELKMTTYAISDKEYYVNGRHGEAGCFEALAVLK